MVSLLCLLIFSGCASKQDVIQVDEKVTQVRNDQRLLKAKIDAIDSVISNSAEQDDILRAEMRTSIKEMNEQVNRLMNQLEDLQQMIYNLNRTGGTSRSAVIPPPVTTTDSAEVAVVDSTIQSSATSVDCRNLWENAIKDMTRGQYELAVSGFSDYLSYCPDGDLSDNSQYWIAEASYEMKQFEKATEEYKKLIAEYPDSEKIPTAYFKLGLCAEETGDSQEALEYYRVLRDKYPSSLEYDLVKDKIEQGGEPEG